MLKIVGRIVSAIVTTGWIAAVANADNSAPVQVWFLTDTKEWDAKGTRMARYRLNKYGLPRPDGTSRLEPELQARPREGGVEALEGINAKMTRLVKSPRSAAGIFGKGYRVVRVDKEPRKMWDAYHDTADGMLAATGGGWRLRTANGITKINFKPGTAHRFRNGVAHRVEYGVNVITAEDVGFFEKNPDKLTQLYPNLKLANLRESNTAGFLNSRLRENPGRFFRNLYPGRKTAELSHVVDINQKRTIYELHKKGTKVAEITVDLVRGRDASNPDNIVEFPRTELEVDHISLVATASQKARQRGTQWEGPHLPSDTRNPALTNSPEVKEGHRLSEMLTKYADLVPSGESKYSEARKRLKLPEPTYKPRAKRTRAPKARSAGRTGRRVARPPAARPRQARARR